MEKNKRNDLFLILFLFAASGILWVILTFGQTTDVNTASVVVKVDGKEYARYPLSADRQETITFPDSSMNVLEIRDGKASVTEASCPDKICVNHRSINKTNQSIVCLPHKLVITIEQGEDDDVDTTTN
jgi:hypothetical protein